MAWFQIHNRTADVRQAAPVDLRLALGDAAAGFADRRWVVFHRLLAVHPVPVYALEEETEANRAPTDEDGGGVEIGDWGTSLDPDTCQETARMKDQGNQCYSQG